MKFALKARRGYALPAPFIDRCFTHTHISAYIHFTRVVGEFAVSTLKNMFFKLDEDFLGKLAQASTLRARKRWCDDVFRLHIQGYVLIATEISFCDIVPLCI